MKISKIEKIFFGFVISLFLIVFVGVHHIFSKIESEGGIKQVIIKAGKEVKDIKKEIDKE